MKRKRSYKRGYPVAVLVGFEDDRAVLWQVFSHVVKPHLILKLNGKRTNEGDLYNFHESIIEALRPALKEGVGSIVVTAPMKTTYASDFLEHVQKHHAYLTQAKNQNRVTFAILVGSADQPSKMAELVKTKEFLEIITETTAKEADNVVNMLEKHLFSSNTVVLFSLKEIEDAVYDREDHTNLGIKYLMLTDKYLATSTQSAKESHIQRIKYLMLTDKYLADNKDKNRINRLLQVSRNKKVKTRVINAETPAGKRISQFGGIIFFTLPTK